MSSSLPNSNGFENKRAETIYKRWMKKQADNLLYIVDLLQLSPCKVNQAIWDYCVFFIKVWLISI